MIHSPGATPPAHPDDPAAPALNVTSGAAEDSLGIVLHAWRQILIIGVVAALIGAVVGLLSTPIYRAEVTLVPAKKDDSRELPSLSGGIGSLASLAGVNLNNNDGETDRALAILHSKDFTIAFIRDNSLVRTLCKSCDSWWHIGVRKPPTLQHAYDYFDNDVRAIQQDKKANTVTVSIDWTDRDVAARWANELVTRLNHHEQQDVMQETARNIAFLNDQAAKTDLTEMRQYIYQLIEKKTSDLMLAAGRPEYAFTVIDPAIAPEDRLRPRRVLLVLTGLVLGLIAGSGWVLVRWRVNRAWRPS